MTAPPGGWSPERRYYTADGEPPGMPPPAPPPPYTHAPVSLQPSGACFASHGCIPIFPPSALPAPAPAPPPAAAQVPTPNGPRVEAPTPAGFDYLYPAANTSIHVFTPNHLPYESPGTEARFRIFKVYSGVTIKQLIVSLGGTGGNDKKCGVTECVERGDGMWSKGATVYRGDAAASRTLASMGWDHQRGDSRMPVWLALHWG